MSPNIRKLKLGMMVADSTPGNGMEGAVLPSSGTK
jgi:hypothetical protein